MSLQSVRMQSRRCATVTREELLPMTMLAALVSSVVLGAYLVAAQQPPPAPQQTMINKTTAISEKGEPIKGAGDTPNQHDILTGSQPDGRAYTDGADHTCGN